MQESTRLLRDLVALPSVNPMGRTDANPHYFEHRVTDYLEAFFRTLGVPYERQPVAPQRDNIVARCELPGARRTLVLEAHQDTVPTDNMTIEPFAARIDGNRLYGRGACDIKGGMAAMLTAFARVVRDKPHGAANVMMACTVDEEHTFKGVQRLVQHGFRADAAIVAEPTDLNIVNAHKGIVRWELVTTGRSCHSSRPEQGKNAIYVMGRVLTGLERYAEQLFQSRQHPLLGRPTLSVGRVEGGTSVNTVPDRCRIEIDRRLLPGEEPLAAQRDVVEFLRTHLGPEVSFECAPPWMSKGALNPEGSEALVADFGAVIDGVRGAHKVEAVPYGTDASNIAGAGVPTAVFGPGDIGKAHTCDEWVPLDEVEMAGEILYRWICRG